MAQAQIQQSHAGGWTPRRDRTLLFVGVFLLVSVLGHVAGFSALGYWAGHAPPPKPNQQPVEMEIVHLEPPPPPKEPEPEPEQPKPPPAKVKPPPLKVATTKEPPPPPKENAPPPPNDTPPDPKPAKSAPLVVGISMSSTTSAGNIAAPVGNTSYGKTGPAAKDPGQVNSYQAPKYVPSYQLDAEPEIVSDVKIAYPPEARSAGVEGTVELKIMVDASGTVTSVKVLKGPGYGLEEAAAAAMKRFKWKPGTKNGQPVSTEINYRYTFYLD